MTCISLVASAWKSTSRVATSDGASLSTASTARQGLSIGFMKSRPSAQQTSARSPLRPSATHHRRPVASSGRLARHDDVLLRLEGREHLAAAVDVVAQRDRVDARLLQLGDDLRRQPRPRRGVLGIGDDQIEPLLNNQTGQRPLDDFPSGLADDVADEEKAHRLTSRFVRRGSRGSS